MPSTLADQACAAIKRAEARTLWVVTAESCTAGALATLLADTPGAGACFHGGFVTYAKACKTEVLGVPEALIAAHTAVSREVAEAMARGALTCCTADVAVAITGVIGPEPDDDGNPVGLTHICAAARRGPTLHTRLVADGASRAENREQILREALTLLQRVLE